ncbi:MAG: hypothetical protein HOE02_05540, partial [Candidatus Marinimicrobia bacterium]|nr:hypothetical protein [Candidatus Neomarinimicrobiota bacterium]
IEQDAAWFPVQDGANDTEQNSAWVADQDSQGAKQYQDAQDDIEQDAAWFPVQDGANDTEQNSAWVADQDSQGAKQYQDAQDYKEYIIHLESLIDKDKVLTHWQDSRVVVLLSAFLKEYSEFGITLEMSKAKPILCFDPGLRSETADPERWSIARHAMALMEVARPDLQTLLSNDLLRLKEHKDLWT